MHREVEYGHDADWRRLGEDSRPVVEIMQSQREKQDNGLAQRTGSVKADETDG